MIHKADQDVSQLIKYIHCSKCKSVDIIIILNDDYQEQIRLKCNTCGDEFTISQKPDLRPVTEQIQEEDSFPSPFIGHQQQI